MNLDLSGTLSEEEAAGRVARAVRDTAGEDGSGGADGIKTAGPEMDFPTRASLDRVSASVPVFLTRRGRACRVGQQQGSCNRGDR